MDKVNIQDVPLDKVIHNGEGASLYDIGDNKVAKVIKSVVASGYETLGTNYEAKIQDTRCAEISEIIKPTDLLYCYNTCIGYIMDKVDGIPINEYVKVFYGRPLSELALFYSKLEKLVRRAHQLDVIIPDLATFDNILIDKDGNIKLIDFDGMQIGNYKTTCVSQSLGDPEAIIHNSKYCDSNYNFTLEIDKRGLATLLFLIAYGININIVGREDITGRQITVDYLFEIMNINCEPLKHKLNLILDDHKQGVYLSNEFLKYADEYDRGITYSKH